MKTGAIRQFNKHILNRLTGRLARLGLGPFAIIRHVGRRSGRPYETTLIVVPIEGAFMIALTYGADVDWYKNVQAAAGCQILWRGQTYAIDEIEPMPPVAARPLFPQPERTILRLMGTGHFVRMRCQSMAT